MKSLFDAHRKDGLPPERTEVINDMKEMVQTYLSEAKTKDAARAKAIAFSKQLGMDTSKFTDEEWQVLTKVLQSFAPVRRVKKRK